MLWSGLYPSQKHLTWLLCSGIIHVRLRQPESPSHAFGILALKSPVGEWSCICVCVYVFLHQFEKLLSLRISKPITFANGTTFPFRNSKLIVLFAGAIGNWAGGRRTNGFSFLKQETSESRSKGKRNKLNVVHECDKKAYFSIYLKATRRTKAFNPQM